MIENLIFSINAILPVFAMVVLGWILKNIGFLNDSFFSQADKFIFKIALPCNLFVSVMGGDPQKLRRSLPLMLFCVLGLLTAFALAAAIAPIFIKSDEKRGAFIQGSFRGNFAILGLPLAENLFGAAGRTTVAVIMPPAIISVNVLSVIILSVYAPKEFKKTKRETVIGILKSIATNPLIIGVAAGLVAMLLKIKLPTFVDKTVNELSDTVFAFALMSLGASFSFKALKGRILVSLVGALVKTVLLPLTAVSTAVLLGFRGVELGVILILFGAPVAVSSYIMAKNMRSDYEVASQILLISTLFCMFTLFFGVFILKSFAFI